MKECFRFKPKEPLNFKFSSQIEKHLLSSVFGFCVGDALGVPVEFTSREDRKNDPVKEMRAYGTHRQYFGTWSDDTSMTLCLVESLIENRKLDLASLAESFCDFYYNNYWTPFNNVFDLGNATTKAIEKMKNGISPVECGGEKESDNGNGSLMRVLPLAFYLQQSNANERIKTIEDVSSLTHRHNRSKLACIIYVQFIIELLRHLDDKHIAYKRTMDFVQSACADKYKAEFHAFERVLNGKLLLADEREIKSSGYVIDSLEAALWVFMTTESYEEAVLRAINLGGDTDTIAAITGGLAGIKYGIESIPDRWLQSLARKDDIYNLLMRFYSQ